MKKLVAIRLDESLLEELKKFAKANDMTQVQLIRKAIRRILKAKLK